MDLGFTKASSLAIIDSQLEDIARNITPAQYEIIRQVIYVTADLDYQSLLKFSDDALVLGANAVTARTPIIVDVPEIQVSIVPQLQKTFGNPVYCCGTTKGDVIKKTTKAAQGLEILASKYPQSIFIVGQDQAAMSSLITLLQNKVIEPRLAIATPPTFGDNSKQRLIEFLVPYICLENDKGGAGVAAAIFNSLVNLTWQISPENKENLINN
ncbi:MAG: precorrin-8X methylmutase [Cyanobacteria bacterium P01_A01_bin.83]